MDPTMKPPGPGRDHLDTRRRGQRKTKTISARRLPKVDFSDGIEIDERLDELRPKTRADCLNGPRPCPWVGCKYHLYLDVSPKTGSLKLNFPTIEPWEMEESCVLDLADRGPISLDEVGRIMNLTRERIRQLEVLASEKIRQSRLAVEYRDYVVLKGDDDEGTVPDDEPAE